MRHHKLCDNNEHKKKQPGLEQRHKEQNERMPSARSSAVRRTNKYFHDAIVRVRVGRKQHTSTRGIVQRVTIDVCALVERKRKKEKKA